MTKHHSHTKPIRVGFILIPGFGLTSFSLAIETLSVANLLQGQTLYDYTLYSANTVATETQVISSNKVPVQTEAPFSACIDSDILCICAYRQAAKYDNAALFNTLRRCQQRGIRFASLASGSFILARAGLLRGYSCTLANEHVDSFTELYPDIPVQENLYTVTGNVLTCAGGTSALDMLLYIIAMDYGRAFANQVAQQFLHERIRSSDEIQNTQRYLQLRMKSACLGAAIEVMEANIESPCTIDLLARKVGTTTRNLELVFRRYESSSPSRYYLGLRLARARRLIEETHLPIVAIAQATGFSSQSYFTKRFREAYQVSPRQLRLEQSL